MHAFQVRIIRQTPAMMTFNPLRVEAVVEVEADKSKVGCEIHLSSGRVWQSEEPYPEVRTRFNKALSD